MENNYVELVGVLTKDMEYDHELYGEIFFKTEISVKRSNGVEDIIPVIVSGNNNFICGDRVHVYGQFRSYDELINGKAKLKLFVFIKEINITDEEDMNYIYLFGYICKDIIYRKTPKNRIISDIILAVNRPYGKTDYIPCIAWEKNADFIKEYPVGTLMEINGRIQSRAYEKGNEIKIAYEVSITELQIAEE